MTPETPQSQLQIPLANLRPGAKSKVDSRRTQSPVEGLRRSIETHGVLIPLLVRENGAGTWDVLDGNRRLRALAELAKRDSIKPEHLLVPCVSKQVEGEAALELSMVANVERENLHPVDRFEVFAALIKAGTSIDDLAKRYGMKITQVRQALAIAAMAPEVRDAWRAGTISAEAAEAFTVTADRKAQAAALKKIGKHGNSWAIRRELIGTSDMPDGMMLKFVGRIPYLKAGGELKETLFSTEDDSIFVSDRGKLRAMVREKLDAECEKLIKAGWKWAVRMDAAPKDIDAWKRPYIATPTKAQMAQMGATVELGHNGNIFTRVGIIKPGDAVAAPKSPAQKKAAAKEREKAKVATGGVSRSLASRLTAQLTQGIVNGVHGTMKAALTGHITISPKRLYEVASPATRDAMMKAIRKEFDAADYFKNATRELCREALKEMKVTVKPEIKRMVLAQTCASTAKRTGWLPEQLRIDK
jgi:ParB/RepB/Spo0J family partition protein